MPFLRLNTANRLIGALLLVSLGILATLLALTIKGSAVPAVKPYLQMTLSELPVNSSSVRALNGTILVVYHGGGQYPVAITPVLPDTYEWQKQSIRTGAEIAGGVTVLLGLLYLGLKRLIRENSEEIFP